MTWRRVKRGLPVAALQCALDEADTLDEFVDRLIHTVIADLNREGSR